MSLPEHTIDFSAAACCKRMLTIEEDKECEELKFEKGPISFSVIRDNSSTCFYSTLDLKSLKNIYIRGEHLVPSVQADSIMLHNPESGRGGGEVLPICDLITSESMNADDSSHSSLNKKRRAISRMKELLKWAASAKSENGGKNKRWKVLHLRGRGTNKATCDEISSDSSKISFSWDSASCSTASSSFSAPMPLASSHGTQSKRHFNSGKKEICASPKVQDCRRGGHWITTDSEFVVLEL